MEEITRCATITAIGKQSVSVAFSRGEACGNCAARQICSNGGFDATAQIPVSDTSVYHIGQTVQLSLSSRNAARAVILAYALPLILMLSVLFGYLALKNDEGTAAIISLLSVVAYYLILFVFRHRFRNQTEIRIR